MATGSQGPSTADPPRQPPTSRVVRVRPYDEFCTRVPIDRIAAAPDNRIAWMAPRRSTTPPNPIDHTGLVQVPDRRPQAQHLPESWWDRPYETPAMYVASLRNVSAFGGVVAKRTGLYHTGGHTLVVANRHLVPDSLFHRSGAATTPSELLVPVNRRPGAFLFEPPEYVEKRRGLHYLLGGAHDHFGHFLLESLARLWPLPELLKFNPTFVVYQRRLAPWQLELLQPLGIRPERILCLQAPMRFEHLLVPSLAFHLHRWTSREQDTVWERLGDHFEGRTPHPAGERVYLSRSRFTKRRSLVNEKDVEELFRSHGFSIVYPETLPLSEQIALARSAQVLAGPAGSATYLGAFQRRGSKKFIISPHNYTLIDDHLISSERGGRLDYFVCPAKSEPRGGISPRYQNYTADLTLLAGALEASL